METLSFKAFRASDEPELCAEFLRQHRKVLEDFGITNVTTNTASWTSDPDTFVIVAISSRLGMVGGIRVEIDKPHRHLPIRDALFSLDPSITDTLERLQFSGNAEVCGLWNANSYSSKGLPSLLAFAAVSVANQIGIRSMVCLVAHYTLRHALKAGFTVIENLGDGGTFIYPIPSIRAIAMIIPDVTTLAHAHSVHRQSLFSLRLRPNQKRVELIGGDLIELDYQLCICGKLVNMTALDTIEADRLLYAKSA